MKDLTLVLPYYINAGILAEQQRVWAAYPDDLKARLHVIVVDDCSPKDPALPHVRHDVGLASFRLYRTAVDVRWNWLFCRNLGVSKATTDWVLLTDIDHVMPEATLRTVLTSRKISEKDVYRLSRVDAPHLTPYKPHPNTWLLTRKLFDRVGGYDERFSGFYGSDADFRERVHSNARAVVMLPDVLIRYPREVIPDASTTTYGRKEEQDGKNVPRIKAERALIPNWTPKRLSYEYEQLV